MTDQEIEKTFVQMIDIIEELKKQVLQLEKTMKL